MLAGMNDIEMLPLGGVKAPATQIPPQHLHSPFPNYYYAPTAQPVPTVPSAYSPYYYGATPSAVYPIYPVTQYPVFSIPNQAPLLQHQKFTLPSVNSMPIESMLPSYAQLFPPAPQKQQAPPRPISYDEDRDFFNALRPITRETAPVKSEKVDLPNLERLMQDIKVEATSDLLKNVQQRCKNCCNYYLEDNNHEKACFYHSGRFKTPETVRPIMMPMGNLQRWTCCRATSKEALGCKNCAHVRDEQTTKIIDRFQAASAVAPRHSGYDSSLLVQLDSNGEWEELKQTSEALSKEMLVFQKFHSITPPPQDDTAPPKEKATEGVEAQGPKSNIVKHVVIVTDTLSGLALKYGVKAADIKRANNLLGDSIFERKHLDIPNPTRIPEDSEIEGTLPKSGREAIAIGRFMATAKCDKNEAKFYLVDHDWDLNKALACFIEDEEWSKAHPYPNKARKRS